MSSAINTTEIGKGLYDLMDNNQQAAVAFGMIPKEIIDLVMDKIKKRISDILAEDLGLPAKDIYPCLKEDFLNELEHDISLAIYGRAKELNRMIA